MTRSIRLIVAGAVLLVTACASEPTAPPHLRAHATATHDATDDGSIDQNPDGTCRSGYSVTDGRCKPI